MEKHRELHQLSQHDFGLLIGNLSLLQARELLPILYRYCSVRRLAWTALESNSAIVLSSMELEFAIKSLEVRADSLNKPAVINLLVEIFETIKSQEEYYLESISI
jgi:hypothetical protein